jgi:hypothetical protein
METFMLIFQVVFAILISGVMIKTAYILKPKDFDEEPKPVNK